MAGGSLGAAIVMGGTFTRVCASGWLRAWKTNVSARPRRALWRNLVQHPRHLLHRRCPQGVDSPALENWPCNSRTHIRHFHRDWGTFRHSSSFGLGRRMDSLCKAKHFYRHTCLIIRYGTAYALDTSHKSDQGQDERSKSACAHGNRETATGLLARALHASCGAGLAGRCADLFLA